MESLNDAIISKIAEMNNNENSDACIIEAINNDARFKQILYSCDGAHLDNRTKHFIQQKVEEYIKNHWEDIVSDISFSETGRINIDISRRLEL